MPPPPPTPMPKKLQRKLPVPKQPAALVPQGGGASADRGSGLGLALGRNRVTPRVLAEFTSQLAVLLNAGIPITKSLRILEGQLQPGPMKRIAAALVEDVEGGTALSEAMQKHDLVFDALYTNMVRAGEAGGVQEEILNRLSGFLVQAERIKSRVKGALAYPVAIMIVALLVLLLVFAFVIPRFKQVFETMGRGELHWTTQVVMGVGEHMKVWWWAYLLAVVLVLAVHRLLMQKVMGYRRLMHRVALRMPLFGPLVHKSLVARFARTFGTLIQSGVPHLDALDILQASTHNVHMKGAVGMVQSSIKEGAGFAVPMGESHMFDDIVVNMVDVGEQTGELDRMLAKVADRYETEVDQTVETTFKAIEPILLVVMAVVVGFIVFALFMPLLTMMQQISRR
ncbi:MAG: type II secretion system F family protein [Planctomycetes bacterium]|nr:type II secretion system F family protein [Planctomycetota bacterium]